MKKTLIGLVALLSACNSNPAPEYEAAYTPAAKVQLAQCLAENATMYGAYWCGWCNRQKEEFGPEAWNTFKRSYVECSEMGSEEDQAKCAKDKVTSYPYWKFKNGKDSRGYLPLENLAEISGCNK
ncbi:MAG: hypothetical protein AABY40_00305 [Nanoarchaeota archaeon]